MKKLLLFYPILVLFFGFSLGQIADQKMKDILSKIQLSEDDAENMIFSNASAPSFFYPNPKDLKSIASGEKHAMVPIIGSYIKSYTKSDEFLKKYMEYREAKKPKEPEAPQSANSMKEQQKVEMEKGIENMKKVKASMPADQQGMFDETIKDLEAQLKALDDPENSIYNADLDKAMQQGHQQQIEDYKMRLAQWEVEYPVNPAPMIKKWLNNFLEISKDVDYSAQTKLNGQGQKIFVNQNYENKHFLWKLCYRNGKEVAESGRNFAEAWLREIK